MGVFTFVCRSSGGEWTAKQHAGDLEASASSTFDLQRRLVQAALSSDSSGGVQSSFSYVTPCSAVFQVICSILVVHYFVVCGKVGIFSLFFLLSIIFINFVLFSPELNEELECLLWIISESLVRLVHCWILLLLVSWKVGICTISYVQQLNLLVDGF